MKVHLNKWGNSMGVRIPYYFIRQLDIREETSLEMFIEGEKIIISKSKYNLDDLLAGVDPNNVHKETGTGKHFGKEIW